MKIYLASNYSHRLELVGHATELAQLGVVVCSSWLHTNWQDDGSSSSAAPEEKCAEWAMRDMKDVFSCDVLVQFTSGERSRGGKHVELGMALALNKRVLVVGLPEHIFHRLPMIEQFGDWPTALERLKSLQSHKQ